MAKSSAMTVAVHRSSRIPSVPPAPCYGPHRPLTGPVTVTVDMSYLEPDSEPRLFRSPARTSIAPCAASMRDSHVCWIARARP